MMIFGPHLALSIMPSDPGDGFLAAGSRFHAITESYITAFYDRILDEAEELVGFELTPVAGTEFLVSRLLRFEYVESVDEDRRVRVFFGTQILGSTRSVSDQAFGGRIYETEGGQLALSIELDWLDPKQVSALSTSIAEAE